MTQFNRIIEDPKVISEIEGARIGVDFYEYKFIYESFNDIIRKVANLTNTLLIDLDKDIPKDPNLFFDTIHVNDDGSKLVAKVISKKLEELINWIPHIQKLYGSIASMSTILTCFSLIKEGYGQVSRIKLICRNLYSLQRKI